MPLDRAAAIAAVQALADRLGLPLLEAAEGVVAVLNANMANAIRARTVQKGIDPRKYALVASGGAGPLHGAEVAQMLGIPEVVVPPYPGINSAIGLLTTDLKYDVVRTAFLVSTKVDLERLNADLAAMEKVVRAQLAADGLDPAAASFQRSADARYVGQGYELRLALPQARIGAAELEAALDAFHALHEREYGHHFAQSPIELVNLRVTAVAQVPKIRVPPKPAGGSLDAARMRIDNAVFRVGVELKSFETTFYDRGKLPLGQPIPGPAIVLQVDSTTVVPPYCRAEVDESGSIILRLPSVRRDG
jgi:N-methylhydantoinase A